MNDFRFVFARTGGPEVLETAPADAAADLQPGQVRVRHEAIGFNLIDIYFRTGVNPVNALPSGIGLEAVGTVEAVGEGVDYLSPGQRVGYATGELGSYSTVRNMPADLVFPVPDWLPSDLGAALLTKGMTTDMLVNQCAKVQPGQTALVLAAAGGVGSLLVQWLKAAGARVIAHAGSPEKAARAAALGADEALSCPYDELPAQVKALTGGRKANVIFESVGADSWAASMRCIARTGLIARFGTASGRPPAVTTRELADAGSIFVTRPNTFHYNDSREKRIAAMDRVFRMVEQGLIRADIGQRFALKDAAAAHSAVESRQTVGSTVLLP